VLQDVGYTPYLKKSMEDKFGLTVDGDDPRQISMLATAMERLPRPLAADCGIRYIGFRDLGPSREYYPNHGLYEGNKLYLNTQLLSDDQVFLDPSGRSLNRFDHTLYHEMGHGWDERNGDISLKPEWVSLSGWSKDPQPGLERITIREEGVPDHVGPWYSSPGAGYTRFYARIAPWEDFADSFAFYVAGLSGFLPASKIRYFDNALWRYWVA
jgi:hypothetical protein